MSSSCSHSGALTPCECKGAIVSIMLATVAGSNGWCGVTSTGKIGHRVTKLLAKGGGEQG